MELTEALTAYSREWAPNRSGDKLAIDPIDQFCGSHDVLTEGDTQQLKSLLSQRDSRWISQVFAARHDFLSEDDRQQLISLRSHHEVGWIPQSFASRILQRYNTFDRDLMEPMLWSAIDCCDRNFHECFLSPCMRSFGSDTVVDWLVRVFARAELITRIRISSLVYTLEAPQVDFDEYRRRRKMGVPLEQWLSDNTADLSHLKRAIVDAAGKSNNLVELYHYQLAFEGVPKLFSKVPVDANGLLELITGDRDYEELLYDGLGWERRK